MRREGSNWAYLLTLLLAAAMTVALLPACGSSGGDSCNTPANQTENNEAACDAEEDFEETEESFEESEMEMREENGISGTFEDFLEFRGVAEEAFPPEDIEELTTEFTNVDEE